MNTLEPLFKEFPKMARLSRECIITEKIDGTNAQIIIREKTDDFLEPTYASHIIAETDTLRMYAASRTRLITTRDDNYSFAKWVALNSEQLFSLGVGRHFGEWWGQGIQRNYGLKEKRFSLFNVTRWCLHHETPQPLPASPDPRVPVKYQDRAPVCCNIVPILYRGQFSTYEADKILRLLDGGGSVAAEGFSKPEGIVVFHTAAQVGFKKTVEGDESPKSLVK